MKELERKPYSSESMRVRCPHCRKLYLVQFNDVKEAKPRFECVQCHSRFWLSLPDMDLATELIGIPIQMKESPQKVKPKPVEAPVVAAKSEPCPKCFKSIQVGIAECPHCGVRVDKMKNLAFQESGPGRSEALATAWQKVLANYAEESLHLEFIRLAQAENNLAYAGARYGQMLKLMPTDETTSKRVREVQAMAQALIPPPLQEKARSRLVPRMWQIPLAISILMMLFGMILPVFRNIVGVGAALFFVALAIQIQLRPRS